MDASTAAVFVGIAALFLGLWQMNNSLNERMDNLRIELERKMEREVDGVRRELSAHIDRNYNELLALRSVILGSRISSEIVSSAYEEVVKKSGGAGSGSDS